MTRIEANRKYKVIYADPPWQYNNKRTGRDMNHGALENYPVMSLEEIKALNIKEIADKNGVLFLWATVPMLPEAMGRNHTI